MKKTQIEYIKAEIEELSAFDKWVIGKSCASCRFYKKESLMCKLFQNKLVPTREDSLCECYIKKK